MKVHNFDRKRELDLEFDPEVEERELSRTRPWPGKRATADGIPRPPVQRKASGHRATSAEVQTRTGGGVPLPEDVRRKMERAFGADFSEVRIHEADGAATAVGAKAFTQGSEIHFAPGEYDPGSTLGLELLGHELAHVVQQAQGRVAATGERGGLPASDDSWLEHEADQMGARAARDQATEAGTVEVSYGMSPMPQHAPVQRQKAPAPAPDAGAPAAEDRKPKLESIQGHWMLYLLPEVAAVRGANPFTAEEYTWARDHFGPRLVSAMRTVEAKLGGQKWLSFITANHGDVQSLPDDQVGEIMGYLGVPRDQLPVRVTNEGNSYDAIVDMGSKEIWILYRAKVEVAKEYEGKFNRSPGQVIAEFAPKFKASIEAAWSGHPVKLDKPLGGISAFTTKVSVESVESGQHLTWYIVPEDIADLGSNVNDDRGQIREHADQPVTHKDEEVFADRTGRSTTKVTNTQVPAAHEFGHAIGLHHVRAAMKGAKGEYGQTPEERSSIMGTGMNMGVIKDSRGKVLVDPMSPFKKAAEEWGKVWFPGGVSRLNRWQDPH